MEELTLRTRLQQDLAFIENKENYYAMFKYVIEKCATAELENLLLFNAGYIADIEYVINLDHIQKAKELAIKTHGMWTIEMLEQSKTQHTPRTLVSSVYSDIFNIVLKPKDGNQ